MKPCRGEWISFRGKFSERFAMIRLGGQTLASYGAMSTACCTRSTSDRRVLVPQIMRDEAATGWPTRRSAPQAPRLSPRTAPRYARSTHARGGPWLASRGHGIPPPCRELQAAWLRDGEAVLPRAQSTEAAP